MLLRRRYAISLFVVTLLGVGYLVVPRVGDAIRTQRARDELAAAVAAVNRLRVPADFVPLKTGCTSYRCYRVPQPTVQVAPTLLGILDSVGAQRKQLEALMNKLGAAPAKTFAPITTAFPSTHVQAALSGCFTVHTRRLGEFMHCAYVGVVDDHVIDVFMGPYYRSQTGRATEITHDSQVDIDFGCGAESAPEFATSSDPCRA